MTVLWVEEMVLDENRGWIVADPEVILSDRIHI
jgi:streptomycin 6-kinase